MKTEKISSLRWVFVGFSMGFVIAMILIVFNFGNIQEANGLMRTEDCLLTKTEYNQPVDITPKISYGEFTSGNLSIIQFEELGIVCLGEYKTKINETFIGCIKRRS